MQFFKGYKPQWRFFNLTVCQHEEITIILNKELDPEFRCKKCHKKMGGI